MALGIDEEKADALRKAVETLGEDLPGLTNRVEEIEILIKATAFYNRAKDKDLWIQCLDKAKLQVTKQNDEMKTRVR